MNWLDWLTEPFSLGFMQHALYEMLLISLLAGVIGTFVVLRGIAFIVDGLSHAILPGIGIAFLLNGSLFWGGVVAAIITTILISYTSRSKLVSEDSAIGILFSGAFALGVIIISKLQTGGRNISEVLFGQLFAVTEQDLQNTLIVGGIIVGVLFAFRKELLFSSFDPAMAQAMGYRTGWLDMLIYVGVALTVVVALPAVGNILVLAFLITPAATARLLTDRLYYMIGLACLIALGSSLIGLYLSYYTNIAGGGATIVVVSTTIFLSGLLLSPKHGVLGWLLSRRLERVATVSAEK